MKHRRWLPLFLPLVAIPFLFPLRTITAQVAPQFGEPLPGLPDDLLAAFHFGKEKFAAVQTPGTGLGPVFNGKS